MPYKSGDWLVICDVCGKEMLASKAKQRWDGFIVCSKDWEPRHPMDFLKVRKESNRVPFTRPEPADVFVEVPYISTGNDFCTHMTRLGLAGFGTAGCATVGNTALNGLL
jgi:hypothetical protein